MTFITGALATGIIGVILTIGYVRLIAPNQSTTYTYSSPSAVVDIVNDTNPAVASILITEEVPILEQYFEEIGGPLSRFRIPRVRESGEYETVEIGGGSAFFISDDGYLVTNLHVVNDIDANYTVILNTGEAYEAKIIGFDKMIDTAVLKIDAKNTDFLTFGNSDQVQVGESVIAIGNALGAYSNTVSTGVISGLSRTILAADETGTSELRDVLQTDAAINSGNSGGPLLNMQAEVIGVNVAVADGSENIAFSLPSNAVQSSVDQIIEFGKVARPYIGIQYVPVNAHIENKYELNVSTGVLIIGSEESPGIVENSPADEAGLLEGDVITHIGSQELSPRHSLSSIIERLTIGDQIEFTINREGNTINLFVTLGARD